MLQFKSTGRIESLSIKINRSLSTEARLCILSSVGWWPPGTGACTKNHSEQTTSWEVNGLLLQRALC